MAIEIVDFPIKNGGSFQFAMLNYQRVSPSFGEKNRLTSPKVAPVKQVEVPEYVHLESGSHIITIYNKHIITYNDQI